jgi:predicted nucleic acid-binding protein
MKRFRVILDTNVVLSAMRSEFGASHKLLMTLGHPRWQSVITSALMYEYEDVARRLGAAPGLSSQDITNILDMIYRESHRQFVWFSWRHFRLIREMTLYSKPLLPDDAIMWYRSTSGTCG